MLTSSLEAGKFQLALLENQARPAVFVLIPDWGIVNWML